MEARKPIQAVESLEKAMSKFNINMETCDECSLV